MEATLAERGQVVIPKAIRDQLGMTPGMLLTFTVEDGKLVVRKKVDDAISRARGILKLAPGEDIDQWWREVRGRAPNDPIEPWEQLRDDCDIPAAIRDDHAKRRAAWLAEQSVIDSSSGKNVDESPAPAPNRARGSRKSA
jgi:antitoxin PrlF